MDKTIAYINGQKNHHRKRAFEEEFIEFLTSIASNTINDTSFDDFTRPFHGLGGLNGVLTQR